MAPGVSSTIEVDAGRQLERADVASLAADDAALEIVARQVDDRHGRFDGVLGGRALNGLGDVLLGPVGGRLARLGVEALQQVGGVVPGVAFDLLDAGAPWLRRPSGWRRAPARAAAARRARSYFAAAASAAFSRSASVRSRALQLFVEPLDAQPDARPAPLRGWCSACSSVCGLLALLPRLAFGLGRGCSCAFSLASSSVSFLRVSASRSASLMMRSGLLFGAADRSRRRCACGWRPRRRRRRPPPPG